MQEFELVARERLLLVERLSHLTAGDWQRPSLCEGWAVRHVVAHLVTPFLVGPATMALHVARHRGVAGAMDAIARRIADEHAPDELLAVLTRHARSRFRPPGLPASAPLTDVVAHSADIRWALGDPVSDWAEPARLAPALDFLVSARARAGFVPGGRLRGVALTADDAEWRWGGGETVTGPSLALVMATLGRTEAGPLLRGPGVSRLLGPSEAGPDRQDAVPR